MLSGKVPRVFPGRIPLLQVSRIARLQIWEFRGSRVLDYQGFRVPRFQASRFHTCTGLGLIHQERNDQRKANAKHNLVRGFNPWKIWKSAGKDYPIYYRKKMFETTNQFKFQVKLEGSQCTFQTCKESSWPVQPLENLRREQRQTMTLGRINSWDWRLPWY